MSADVIITGFKTNPDYLLQNFNFQSKQGLIVHISESDYRTASFLDQRVFTKETQGAWYPLNELSNTAATSPDPPEPHYILHVGHCGSTLLSRLLAELPGNLPVREPISLLTLALARRDLGQPVSWISAAEWQSCYRLATRSLARIYHIGERAIVKLTSTAGNLVELLAYSHTTIPQMLLMYVSLESLLTAMLRTPDLRDSVHAYAPKWILDFRRLTGRTDIELYQLSDAQQIAVKWLTLMVFFERAKEANPKEVQLLDFEDFLSEPAQALHNVATHFHIQADAHEVDELAHGPLMRSYSKVPSKPFTPEQRRREFSEVRKLFSKEIESGLRWAERICTDTNAARSAQSYLFDTG